MPVENKRKLFPAQVIAHGAAALLTTLWVGSMWAIGYVAVPVLFVTLPDKMLAGMLAGKMFSLTAYIGIGSACYLLIYLMYRSGPRHVLKQSPFWIVTVMLLLVLVGEFVFQPQMASLKAHVFPGDIMHSAYAGRFRTLHGMAEVVYLLQSLLGGVFVIKAKRYVN
jgi:hypothetical protein